MPKLYRDFKEKWNGPSRRSLTLRVTCQQQVLRKPPITFKKNLMRCLVNCRSSSVSFHIPLTRCISRTNEREKQSIIIERDRQNAAIRTIETNLHTMELRERDLNNEIREKSALEGQIEVMKQDIIKFTTKSKVLLEECTSSDNLSSCRNSTLAFRRLRHLLPRLMQITNRRRTS